MRKLYYVIMIIACGIMVACGKADEISADTARQTEQEEDGTYMINPDDTAGIVVPEGYRLVVFPAAQPPARAIAGGTNTQVAHLQYLIYETDENGNEILYKQVVLSKPESWPTRVPAVPLPENKAYRVVFLGNVSEGVFGSKQTEKLLTGVGAGSNYKDARVHLPQVEFSDANFFFMANSAFDTKPGNVTNNNVYVPITLKRVVNKIDVCREPLKDVTQSFTQENLIDQFLRQKIADKLAQTGGVLHRGIAASVDTLLMALVYVGTKGCAAEADAYYASNPGKIPVLKYRRNNIGVGKPYQLPALKSSLDGISTIGKDNYVGGIWKDCEYASSNIEQNAIVALAQYIYDYFHAGIDNANVNNSLFGTNGILNSVWTTNKIQTIDIINNTSTNPPTPQLSFNDNGEILGTRVSKDIKALFTKLPTSDGATDKVKRDFKPFGVNNTVIRMTVNRMPAMMTFDRTIPDDGYLNNGNPVSLYLSMRAGKQVNEGTFISLVSLGAPTDKLVISEIKNEYSSSGWNGLITSMPNTTAGSRAFLVSGESLAVRQAPNIYRKCVYSVGEVDLADWSKNTTTFYPIVYNVIRLLSATDSSFPMYMIESKNSWDENYHRSIVVNNTVICKNLDHAMAGPLVTIYQNVSMAVYNRANYRITSYIAWIPLPQVKDNLNNYSSDWKVTDETYNPVNE